MSLGDLLGHDPAAGMRVLLDGEPGTVVRSYDAIGDEPGYDVDLDNGQQRWISHRCSKTRMISLPREADPRAQVPVASAGDTDASRNDGDHKR